MIIIIVLIVLTVVDGFHENYNQHYQRPTTGYDAHMYVTHKRCIVYNLPKTLKLSSGHHGGVNVLVVKFQNVHNPNCLHSS